MGRRKSSSTTVALENICPRPLLFALKQIEEPIIPPLEPNNAQAMLIDLLEGRWVIYAWWIIYERIPGVDIRRRPYNTQKFQAYRSKAQILNAQLELCKPVFENFGRSGTPIEYWVELMRERKQNEIDSIFAPLLPKFGGVLQRGEEKIRQLGYLDHWRNLHYCLRELRDVPSDLEKLPKHFKFFRSALKLAWKQPQSRNAKKFRELYWNPFLSTIDYYIQVIEDNPKLKRVFEEGDKLYRNERGKPHSQPYKRS